MNNHVCPKCGGHKPGRLAKTCEACYPRRKSSVDFLERKDTHCWEWQLAISGGYGTLTRNNRTLYAHRTLYEDLVGPIPTGLQIDHLCRNRRCVNPGHLEPVTPRENCLRGESPWAKRARQTHCIHGHPFDEANTGWRGTHRYCITCSRDRALARYHAQKAAVT